MIALVWGFFYRQTVNDTTMVLILPNKVSVKVLFEFIRVA